MPDGDDGDLGAGRVDPLHRLDQPRRAGGRSAAARTSRRRVRESPSSRGRRRQPRRRGRPRGRCRARWWTLTSARSVRSSASQPHQSCSRWSTFDPPRQHPSRSRRRSVAEQVRDRRRASVRHWHARPPLGGIGRGAGCIRGGGERRGPCDLLGLAAGAPRTP